MASVGTSSGWGGSLGGSFAPGVPSVAALDSPQLTQTKSEIRSLVAEIAELSATDVDSDQFLRGMLSRVCMAMGATAAAVWRVDAPNEIDSQEIELTASHNLPADLEAIAANAAAHRRVLACVAAEGQPILVPPGSIRIEAQRPANPIDEALLIVPIRTHNRVDALLEVIQPGSGGPAAQRGYLRFVAQMADLLSDHLRRSKLQQLASEADYSQRLRRHLLAISAAPNPSQRWRAVASAAASLLDADLALVASKSGRRWRVRAISDLDSFDPRSATVTAAEKCLWQLHRVDQRHVPGEVQLLAEAPDLAALHEAPAESDRAASDQSPAPAATALAPAATTSGDRAIQQETASQSSAEGLRDLLACDRLFRMPLTSDGNWQMLLATDRAVDAMSLTSRGLELTPALGALLAAPAAGAAVPVWLKSLGVGTNSQPQHGWQWKVERWVVRGSIVGLVAAIALFPTPDQVATVAVLEAEAKQMYYAPSTATVQDVLVDSGQSVRAGQVLLELADQQLDAQLNEASGQKLATETQLAQDMAALKRGQQPQPQLDELESRTVQSRITLAALDQRLSILQAQSERLTIRAREDAVVTTWDARNRLLGRPVAAGQLLIATCAPDANWRLQLSIDQQKAGLIQDALDASAGGLPVHFSLSSHPSEVRTGRLVGLSQQLVSDESGSAKVLGTVLVDSPSLPARTDGAVARAAVDCGRVPAVWLVLRDAVREASAWIRMTW